MGVRLDLRWMLPALVLVPVTTALGFWQLSRGSEGAAVEQRYVERLAMAPLTCSAAVADPDPEYLRVALNGQFEPGREFLLDNRVRQGRVGFHVLTPFVCEDGTRLVVDRGHLPAGADRSQLPVWTTPTERVMQSGFIDVAEPGLRVADDHQPVGWPRVVAHVDAVTLARELDVYPNVVVLDGAGAGALAFDFVLSAMSPVRHHGYAIQWFALAGSILLYLGYRSWQR